MSYKCSICDKTSKTGNTVSHSHRATKRIFHPNLRRMRIFLDGKVTHEYVCTGCLRSGKITRPPMK
jgi:large subunit ribosomal protein L28